MKELFLFVRPPRPLWPFNSPSSAFWPPLAFASMAAMLRDKVPDLRVDILDAPALHMGWRTLTSEIRARQPAFVGLGEEAVSCVEGLRLARLAKACGAQLVAGGCFFGHVAHEALGTGLLDVVVHGEGELTIVEVVEALREGKPDALAKVAGISFRQGDEFITTRPRPLLADLDALPFPAYDLLPVERYGANSWNHPQLASVELSRGCYGSCDFCVLWRQMGRYANGRMGPQLRVKSPERLLEEVRVLVRRYGRNYLGWVDPCFNAHPQVPGQLAELMLREGLRPGQSAWVRTDALVRDSHSGALDSCVRAGLNELYLGIERPDAASLEDLHKSSGVEDARTALKILREQFPQVCAIGSFIYGLPGDSPKTVRAIHRLTMEMQLDQFFFIPLTPLPGTSGWRPELWDDTGERFREFNFLPAGPPHGRFAALERALFLSVLFNWPATRFRAWFHRSCGAGSRARRVQYRLHGRIIRFGMSQVLKRLLGGDSALGMVYPSWYES